MPSYNLVTIGSDKGLLPVRREYHHIHQCFPIVTWWRHQMETFSALLAICVGNSPVAGEFPPPQGQWRGALTFSLICAWKNGWVNDGEVGDLRRHRAHSDVMVMNWTHGNNLQLAKFKSNFANFHSRKLVVAELAAQGAKELYACTVLILFVFDIPYFFVH